MFPVFKLGFLVLSFEVLEVEGGNVLRRESEFPSLSDFDIPKEATVLTNFVHKSDGSERGSACAGLVKGRRCMNVGEGVPIMEGRDCSWNECLMGLTPGPSSCLVKILNESWNPNDPKRELTCGLQANGSPVIHPGIPLFGSSGSDAEIVLNGTPENVEVKVFSPCLLGELHFLSRITFSKVPAANYTCKGSPTCINGIILSRIVCYTSGEVYTPVLSEVRERKVVNLVMLAPLLVMWLLFGGV